MNCSPLPHARQSCVRRGFDAYLHEYHVLLQATRRAQAVLMSLQTSHELAADLRSTAAAVQRILDRLAAGFARQWWWASKDHQSSRICILLQLSPGHRRQASLRRSNCAIAAASFSHAGSTACRRICVRVTAGLTLAEGFMGRWIVRSEVCTCTAYSNHSRCWPLAAQVESGGVCHQTSCDLSSSARLLPIVPRSAADRPQCLLS